jgi:hypothetical protein
MHTHLLWTHLRKPYPYEHLQRLSEQILEIDEVIIDGNITIDEKMSSTTESTMPLYSRKFTLIGSQTQDLKCY